MIDAEAVAKNRMFRSTPAWERATGPLRKTVTTDQGFDPRPRGNGRPVRLRNDMTHGRFRSTPAWERATSALFSAHRLREVSIHARVGTGDTRTKAWRACDWCFDPRPRGNGRLCATWARPVPVEVSIHARVGTGDLGMVAFSAWNGLFRSTPAWERATILPGPADRGLAVSIHARVGTGDPERHNRVLV